jgi:hypothetical protein
MPLLLPQDPAALALAEAENAAKNMAVDDAIAGAEKWTEELKRIDPHLTIVWIGENSEVGDLDLVPGRWHIKKKVPGGDDEYFPLVGEQGEYREPGGWMLDMLNANDMWNPRAHRDRKEAKRKLREAKVRARALEKEQRQDEMLLAARAAKRMRGDSGLHKRTDKRPVRGIILPPGVGG